jgi:hypothetical protein
LECICFAELTVCEVNGSEYIYTYISNERIFQAHQKVKFVKSYKCQYKMTLIQMHTPIEGTGIPQLELVALLTAILMFNGFLKAIHWLFCIL